jgi:hypothetical protein
MQDYPSRASKFPCNRKSAYKDIATCTTWTIGADVREKPSRTSPSLE